MYPGVHLLFKYLLGDPIIVNTCGKNNLVNNIVNEIKNRDKIFLQIAPSGTRIKTDMWKSGFYHIAFNADIHIVCSYIDSKTKTLGIAYPFKLTGDVTNDMDKIRSIYENKYGLNKDYTSTIFIKEENMKQKKINN